MNKHVRKSLILLITMILLLGITAPGLAQETKSANFYLTYELDLDWDTYTGVGTFDLVTHNQSGVVTSEWGWPRRGTMTFTNDANGSSFTIEFLVGGDSPNEITCVNGSFQIIASDGEYAGWSMRGQGHITMCSETSEGQPESVWGTLEGWVISP